MCIRDRFGCSSGDNGASDQPKDQNNDADAASYTLVKEGTLTVGTSPDYPPFENLDNGEYVGFDIDLAKAVADELGLECEFKTLQFDGIIPAVASGGQCDVGVSGFSVDPKRAKDCLLYTSGRTPSKRWSNRRGSAASGTSPSPTTTPRAVWTRRARRERA